MDFAELQQFAIQKQKLVISAEKLVFPTHKLQTVNAVRPGLQEQMDNLAILERNIKDQVHKNRNVRVELNAKKLNFVTTLFGVGML